MKKLSHGACSLLQQLQESEGRVDILKTQLDSLQRPALSDATNENTTLRVDLAEAQSRLKTVQELVTEEKRKVCFLRILVNRY